MNNEERILSMLEQLTRDVSDLKGDVSVLKDDMFELKDDVSELKVGQAQLSQKLDALEKRVDVIFGQTANLTKFKTEITEKVDDILAVTKVNTFDITRLRAAK